MKQPFLVSLWLLASSLRPLWAEAPVQTKTILSPVYTIDRIYKSMEGPQSSQQVTLLDNQTPELLWITGFQTEMVEADGKTPTLPEFMCHANLDFDLSKHRTSLATASSGNSRILTLSQGQISVKFPKGFGMPIMSDEPLSLATQVLNHNLEHPNIKVRHKVSFEFVRDRDLKEPLKPLFNTSVFGMKSLEGQDGFFGIADGAAGHHGPGCLPGQTAPNAAGGSEYQDFLNKKFTGHWVVKPGREVNHTNVTRFLNLPYDTTLHYAAVHLHPFAESLELVDLTTGKSVFRSKARGFDDKIGLSQVDEFSSEEGVPLYKDHEYDLVSTYNNTTTTDKDSMSVLLLFPLDKQFRKPPPSPPSLGERPAPQGSRVLLKTTAGDLVVRLAPESAPKTAAQFLKLVRAGVYDGTRIAYILPGFLIQTSVAGDRSVPLTDGQRALVKKLPLEPGALRHQRGVLSLARPAEDPDGGETSFCILLASAPHLDGLYTAFATVEKGEDVLQALEKAPRNPKNEPASRIEILKAQELEPEGKSPGPAPSAAPAAAADSVKESSGSPRLVLHTRLGDLTFRLFADVAPQTVAQITKLASLGAYDSTHFFRVEPGFVAQTSTVDDRQSPLTAEQRAAVKKIPAELSGLKHHRGVLSMAREDGDLNSAESSFSVLLGDAPHLDGKYTIFGELETGMDVLEKIEKIPLSGPSKPAERLTITRAETVAAP